MFDRIDIQRIATAAVGAFILSATFVLGAVGPARAAAPEGAAWMLVAR